MNSRLERFLSLKEISYWSKDIEVMVEREDLPTLYAILKDPSYVSKWGLALSAICQIDDPEKAFDVVVQHIRRPHDLGPYEYLSYFQKVTSVVYLGRLDRRITSEFLKRAVTQEGAKEVLAPWQQAKLTVAIEDLEMSFRAKAADAMLRYQDDALIEAVRQEYVLLRQVPPGERSYLDDELCGRFRKTLAVYDMQEDYGLDETRRIIASETEHDFPPTRLDNTLTRYIQPYRHEEDAMWPREQPKP